MNALAFRASAALASATVCEILFGIVMGASASRPLPASCTAAAAIGAAFGYWRSGRLIARHRPPVPPHRKGPRR